MISNKQNLKKHYADGTYQNTRCHTLKQKLRLDPNFKHVDSFHKVAM